MPRVHFTLRVNNEALLEADAEAVKETARTGVRWNRSKVGREWLLLGRQVWLEQRTPKV